MSKIKANLLKIFQENIKPITVNEILEKTSVNKTTVYRNIDKLLDDGTISKVNISSKITFYELSQKKHHHHLICKECSSIEDFYAPKVEEEINKLENLVSNNGFKVVNHDLEIFGFCKSCLK